MDDNTPDTAEMEKLYEKMGKIYARKHFDGYYMLCQIGYCKFTMIGLISGNRVCDGLETLEELTEDMVEVPDGEIVVRQGQYVREQ